MNTYDHFYAFVSLPQQPRRQTPDDFYDGPSSCPKLHAKVVLFKAETVSNTYRINIDVFVPSSQYADALKYEKGNMWLPMTRSYVLFEGSHPLSPAEASYRDTHLRAFDNGDK